MLQRLELRRPLRAAARVMLPHGKLLRQQFVEGKPAPGRMAALLQRGQMDLGGRVMQEMQAFGEGRQLERRIDLGIQRFAEIRVV